MVAFLPLFSFVNNIFTYGIALQATIGEIFARPTPAEKPPATPGRSMQSACLALSAAFNREAPCFRARDIGLGVYTLDGTTLPCRSLPRPTTSTNSAFLSATPDGSFSQPECRPDLDLRPLRDARPADRCRPMPSRSEMSVRIAQNPL
ncbi:hypothetical protein FJW05_05265 [Mesorhizobium sp. B2-9-1]|uniref:hypothetical protein n=1 Tax=unclassified Mesorhizobium TaxID=325217 RepID=UPI00112C3268|nr:MULTISPECIES: hypothetical protein [unclassified Mesorhizobium]TPI48768.1 hypothetical protein FJW05_05265 [Mesorhizobium sp. B2-9-1]TPJ31050.1 hypothetical protein FJ425_04835 [Mesorhizobium sp. B2-7-2]